MAAGTGAQVDFFELLEKLNDPKASLKLEVTADASQALMNGASLGRLSPKQIEYGIRTFLKEKGVKAGLDGGAILRAIKDLAAGETITDLPIATAVPVTPGEDAQIDLALEVPPSRLARVSPDGVLDYKDPGPAKPVGANQLLATLKPARPGSQGVDVLGNIFDPPEVKELALKAGSGSRLSPDGLKIYSTQPGVLRKVGECGFEVLEVMEINGDLKPNSCPINHHGLLRVHGKVEQNCRLTAHVLEADSVENKATMEITGDLCVNGGIVGADLRVRGSISARYIRGCTVAAGGDVMAGNEVVQSTVFAEGGVYLSPLEGRIVNSRVGGLKEIRTADLLCGSAGATIINIGLGKEARQKTAALTRQVENLQELVDGLEQKLFETQGELAGMEGELRKLLGLINDPSQAGHRVAHVAQVAMLKPMRLELKNKITRVEEELKRVSLQLVSAQDQAQRLEKYAKLGETRLVVNNLLEVGVEIRGPHSATVVQNNQRGVVAHEERMRDPETGRLGILMILEKIAHDKDKK